jgi:crotonobetainyl-CoA:carnitine CoA-transferase CaiB-like acyl-CoA transferase
MALDHRRRTGEGTLVEVPQFNSGFNLLAELIIEYSATGRILGRVGNRSWTLAPQGTYRCADAERDVPGVPADDWVSISVEDDAQWIALCRIIGADALAGSPALKAVEGRSRQHDLIDATIEAWTRSRSAEAAAAALCAGGVPAAAIAEAHHLDRLPEVRARGLYELVDHTVLPTLPIVGYPARFEAGPHRVHRRRSPLFGEHNREILEGLLGLSPEEVDALEQQGVIGNAAPTATAW